MTEFSKSRVSNYLGWVFVQGLLLSLVLPDASWAEPSWMLVVAVLLLGWVVFCLARNALRLWSAPAGEASTRTAGCLGLFGLFFAFASVGPLWEGRQPETRLLGASWAVLAAILLFLAVRDVVRVRRGVSVPVA